MNQNQLKDTLNDIQINAEMQKRLIAKCQKRKEKPMNKMMKRIRKPLIAATAAVMLVSISFTAYGQGLFNEIKNFFIGSNAQYIVVEYPDSYPIPEELRGKLFDSDGNEMTVFTGEDTLHNADGEEVRVYNDDNGNLSVLTVEEYNNIEPQIKYVEFNDLTEGSVFFISDFLNPGYLPDGYSFKNVEFFAASKDELSIAGSKYMNIRYSNGTDDILCMLRFMDEETAFVSTSDGDADTYEELKINGHDAVIYKGRSLDIQIGDVMYSYFSFENISADELIKIAESLE